jgi:hypothetical protein
MQSLESGMGYGYSCHVHTLAAGPTGSAPWNTCKHTNTKQLHDPQTISSLFYLPNNRCYFLSVHLLHQPFCARIKCLGVP